jgi:hypothetical protein
MSSILNKNVSELTVAELLQVLQERASQAQPQTKKSKAKKDPEAPKKEVSAGVAAWNAYVGEVLEELKKEGWTNPETGKLTRKDAMAEASKRKAEGNAEYAAASAARRAKRDEQLAKKAGAEPSSPKAEEKPVEEKPVPEKPKKVLSPEHKAKMQAAAKAAREAKKASAAPAASVPPPVVAPPPTPAPAEEEEEWIRKTISGKKHLWNPANNHCYRCEADGSQGDWAGLYNPKTGKIDDSVEEPQDE